MDIVQVPVPIKQLSQLSSLASHVSYVPSSKSIRDHEDNLSLLSSISLPTSTVQSSEETTPPFSVPPTTPATRYSFGHIIEPVFRTFPKLGDFKLPYIRELGIKASLEILSEQLFCQDYKLNAVQFWFLDLIADCLWKMQDEFQFPERYQKIIIEWILYVMDLIRDPLRNLSRKEFFQIFNEALVVANERVQGGCEMLPSPSDLFSVPYEGESEKISFPSESEQSSGVSLMSGGESYVVIGIDENTEIFKLPKEPAKYYQHDASTDDSLLEVETLESDLCGCEQSVDFYQPDLKTPDRFISDSSSSSYQSIVGEDESLPLENRRFLWKRSSIPSESLKNICSDESTAAHPTAIASGISVEPPNPIIEEWTNYLDDRTEYIQNMEKNIMINSCALFAIKQFVYDYFHETFQYMIIKLCLINNFEWITENINTRWHVPKILKEELKKPKPKKEKKKKKKKPKKPKKKTKAKKAKKQKSKQKRPKKDKKAKKPKPKKLTKAEKAELARLKREQQLLEEEERRAEENRRLLFPLKEATDDEFFRSIFEHWIKPKGKNTKDKDKKGKKKTK